MAPCISLSFFIINLIIIFPISIKAQQSSNRNITPNNSSIIANADAGSSTWTSPSGEFAFGFRQVAGGGFLLAVWFDQIPEKTLVWSANRDNPAPSGSTVHLSANGTLELIDERGRQLWAANSNTPTGPDTAAAAYAAVLDTGNLVVMANTSAILWQSFDAPTDTLLPGQMLNRGGVLVSSFSQTNHSKGRFKFTLRDDGNLALYTTRFPLGDENVVFWSTQNLETGFQLIFNSSSSSIYLVARNGSIIRPLFNNGAPAGRFRQRLTLEYDGVLRLYVHPINSLSTAWSAHSFVPTNICSAIREEGIGGGACGFNSICSMGADGRPSCDCPDGYSSRGGVSGCIPDFALQRCDQESQEAEDFRLDVMYNRDWPLMEYEEFRNVDEDWCRQSCLNDCFCAVAIYYMRSCYKKPLPFFNGRENSTFSGKALVKVRINNTMINPNTSASGPNSSKTRSTIPITLGSVLFGISLLLFLLSTVLLFVSCRIWRKHKIVQASKAHPHPSGVETIKNFSFDELREATDGFRDELGRGTCSEVYKGTLNDGKVVAVKKLDEIAREADVEFIAEVRSISRTNHKNLQQLLGYCDEGKHRILVYDFMSNGSLSNCLFENSPRPKWYTRVQIAFAVARGLCYLHEECTTPIIHCDIKPQNVLLDESYTAKLSDFGLAKLLRPNQSRTTTGVRGTRGYAAPEWFRNMPVTVKVDVYSFGILLLELLCCRRNYEADAENEGEVVLADWAYDCYQHGGLDLMVGSDEEAKSDMKMVERMVMTAIWCVQEDPALRPHMKRVMHMLEGSIQVPAPPDPTTFFT